jgi:hypothetical protein
VQTGDVTKRGTWEVALVYAGLGEKDRAFEWLERAYKDHDKSLYFLKVDPTLDPLRSDPRFQDLLRRMNFPPQDRPRRVARPCILHGSLM